MVSPRAVIASAWHGVGPRHQHARAVQHGKCRRDSRRASIMQMIVRDVGDDDGAAAGNVPDRPRSLRRRPEQVARLVVQIALRGVDRTIADGPLGIDDHDVGVANEGPDRSYECVGPVPLSTGITVRDRVPARPRTVEIRTEGHVAAGTETDRAPHAGRRTGSRNRGRRLILPHRPGSVRHEARDDRSRATRGPPRETAAGQARDSRSRVTSRPGPS